MSNKLIQLLGALLGTLLGFGLGLFLLERSGGLISAGNRPAFLMALVAASLLFGYLAIPYVTIYPARRVVDLISEAGPGDFVLGVIAIIVGLVMGLLLGAPLSAIGGAAGSILPPVAAILLALGMLWATLRKRDVLIPALVGAIPGWRGGGEVRVVVDTSSVIDGRIVDIGRTGFILGTLVVPRFVLDELQRIADSPDTVRRNRGRRGLEMLAALQKDSVTPVLVTEETYPEVAEVDAKIAARASRGEPVLRC